MDLIWEQKQQADLIKWLSVDKITSLSKKHGSPIQIISRSKLRQLYGDLQDALPTVEHHFAVKAFPSREVLKILHHEGCGFDVASTGEITLATEAGALPENIIHTHPVKRQTDVDEAVRHGVKTFIYDSLYELDVLEKYKESIQLVLRVSFRTDKAQIDLSYKFGAESSDVIEILKQTKARGFRVAGLSFHAGSQLYETGPMTFAISECARLWKEASQHGIELSLLDIGGGFPVNYTEPVPSLKDFCAPISHALHTHFPTGVRIISEAGRVLCASAAVSVCQVMGVAERDGRMWYYLDDGIYGSYSGMLFEHGSYHIWSLKSLTNPNLPVYPSVLAGPTCDSVDVIEREKMLPKLERGDILLSPTMGAYSWATSVSFNAFPIPRLVFVD